MQETWGCGFNPWVGKTPWRRAQQPTAVFLPGESHGQRSRVGYSPWGCKELDTTELLTHTKGCGDKDGRPMPAYILVERGESEVCPWWSPGRLPKPTKWRKCNCYLDFRMGACIIPVSSLLLNVPLSEEAGQMCLGSSHSNIPMRARHLEFRGGTPTWSKALTFAK